MVRRHHALRQHLVLMDRIFASLFASCTACLTIQVLLLLLTVVKEDRNILVQRDWFDFCGGGARLVPSSRQLLLFFLKRLRHGPIP